MAFDTPARIAILGAGPIGLEAALYARYLGYDVDIYERGYVAEGVRHWGHARLFTPFQSLSSPLGLAAIAAQDPNWEPPAPDALLTGDEWVDRYVLPLAQTDLLFTTGRSFAEQIAQAFPFAAVEARLAGLLPEVNAHRKSQAIGNSYRPSRYNAL